MTVRVQSEKDFQRAVIDLAHTLRWKTAHFNDSRREVRPGVFVGDKDAVGWPDLVLCRRDRLIVAELKAEKGIVSPEQKEWLYALEVAGVWTFVWYPSDWPEIEEALR